MPSRPRWCNPVGRQPPVWTCIPGHRDGAPALCAGGRGLGTLRARCWGSPAGLEGLDTLTCSLGAGPVAGNKSRVCQPGFAGGGVLSLRSPGVSPKALRWVGAGRGRARQSPLLRPPGHVSAQRVLRARLPLPAPPRWCRAGSRWGGTLGVRGCKCCSPLGGFFLLWRYVGMVDLLQVCQETKISLFFCSYYNTCHKAMSGF